MTSIPELPFTYDQYRVQLVLLSVYRAGHSTRTIFNGDLMALVVNVSLAKMLVFACNLGQRNVSSWCMLLKQVYVNEQVCNSVRSCLGKETFNLKYLIPYARSWKRKSTPRIYVKTGRNSCLLTAH